MNHLPMNNKYHSPLLEASKQASYQLSSDSIKTSLTASCKQADSQVQIPQ